MISHIEGKNYVDDGRTHIKEEIADVMVMLRQFQLYFDISDDEIKEIMNSKIERQLKRITKKDETN